MVSRAVYEKLRRQEERKPSFPSAMAARAYFRKWRDALVARGVRAAARDGVALDWSLESIKAFEAWAVGIGPRWARRRTGLSAGELHGAVGMYAGLIAVRDLAFEWEVATSPITVDRFNLRLRRGLGSLGIPTTELDRYDNSYFWGQTVGGEGSFYQSIMSERKWVERDNGWSVVPHRGRLSPELERRGAEQRMIQKGLDPWNERDVVGAFLRGEDLGFQHRGLKEILGDRAVCGQATVRAMRALFETGRGGLRQFVVTVLARHGEPDAAALAAKCLRDTDPHSDATALGILTWLRDRTAMGDVVVWLTELTRGKRPQDQVMLFFHAAAYLRTYGVRTRVVKDVLGLLEARRARLWPSEQSELATVTGAFRGPTLAERRAAGLGPALPVMPIAIMRRMLWGPPRRPVELGFVD